MTRDELITELQLASGRDSSAQDTQIPATATWQNWLNRSMMRVATTHDFHEMRRLAEAFLIPSTYRFSFPARMRALWSAVLVDDPTSASYALKGRFPTTMDDIPYPPDVATTTAIPHTLVPHGTLFELYPAAQVAASYTTGTVTVVNGDATVEGAGSPLWETNTTTDWWFKVDSDGTWYGVDSITDEDTLELSSVYAGTGASGLDYTLARTYQIRLRYSVWPTLLSASGSTPDYTDMDNLIVSGAMVTCQNTFQQHESARNWNGQYQMLLGEAVKADQQKFGIVQQDAEPLYSIPYDQWDVPIEQFPAEGL